MYLLETFLKGECWEFRETITLILYFWVRKRYCLGSGLDDEDVLEDEGYFLRPGVVRHLVTFYYTSTRLSQNVPQIIKGRRSSRKGKNSLRGKWPIRRICFIVILYWCFILILADAVLQTI